MANYRKSFNLRNGVQVDDDNFIVNANGLVGIGTTIPTEFLDVRGNARVVGFITANSSFATNSTVGFLTATQGVSVTGVVSATTFSGSAAGLTGIYAIAVDGWRVTSGSISTTANVGVGTTNPNGAFQVGTGVTISSNGNATYAGVVTASSFNGPLNASNLTGTVDNAILPSSISVSGIITATSGFVGNLTGTASNADSITNTANITVNSINSGFSTTGITTVFTELDVGQNGTAFTALNSGKVGIGTALPTSELQIIKASGSLLEVISNSGSARISIGQSVGVGKSTGVIRFGDTDRTLDIINNDTGNLNYYLHAGSAGINTGRFEWLYGQTNAQLMSLTYGGRLGLGKTNPDNTLHVVGTSTVTGNAWFGGNVTVSGSLNASTLTLSSLTTQLIGNVYASNGISTFSTIQTTNIGIGTTNPTTDIDARNSTALLSAVGLGTTSVGGAKLRVEGGIAQFSSVGVGTTQLYSVSGSNTGSVQIHGTNLAIFNGSLVVDSSANRAIGFGTFIPRSIIDFGNVGAAASTGFMIVPTLTASQRVGLAYTIEGAIIYNSTTKKHQGYGSTNGGVTFGWNDLY